MGYITLSFYLLVLSHSYIPGIGPTLCAVLLVCCWIWVVSILLRIFYIMFTEIFLCSFLSLWFLYLRVKVSWPQECVSKYPLFFFFFGQKSVRRVCINSFLNVWWIHPRTQLVLNFSLKGFGLMHPSLYLLYVCWDLLFLRFQKRIYLFCFWLHWISVTAHSLSPLRRSRLPGVFPAGIQPISPALAGSLNPWTTIGKLLYFL